MNTKITNDYAAMMKDMMSAMPIDATAMEDVFRTQADFADRMSKVVLDAAQKSTEVSASWTRATLGQLGAVTNMKDEPSDYTKAMTDFASSQAEMSADSIAAFTEIAKKVQAETIELMLSAGATVTETATKTTKKAATK